MIPLVFHFENNWYKAVIFHTNNVLGLTLQNIDDPIGLHFFLNHRLNFRLCLFVLFIKGYSPVLANIGRRKMFVSEQ